jgi:hypothetical protein
VNVLYGKRAGLISASLALAATSDARVDSRIGGGGSREYAVALPGAHTLSKNPLPVSRIQAYISCVLDRKVF